MVVANIWKETPYVVLLTIAALSNISNDYYEAAMVDGSNGWKSFWKITLPLIRPVVMILPISASGLASTTIFAFIIAWSEFFYALNFTSTLTSKTLPVLITEFSSKFGNDFILTSTAGVLASLPPVVIALIFQKYIISGLSSGAVKG